METTYPTVDALVAPLARMALLSQAEIAGLRDRSDDLYPLFRRCALAVLSSGSDLDDGRALLARYAGFEIGIVEGERGIALRLAGAPASAFVDGEIIAGMREHLFAVLRDVVFVHDEIHGNPRLDLEHGAGITDAVFQILRNAGVLDPERTPRLVVCWGGHSISRGEYDYTKLVGYELGLRGLDICTGCGPGAMKGPMKGAAIGHAKQRIAGGRYLGLSEPGIIAAEAPNPICNALVILPDIEKRLEAFLRVGHGIVVFPGGVGTAEEIIYVLGVLMHPANAGLHLPLVLTGPAGSAGYFDALARFLDATLGAAARAHYSIIIDDPAAVARTLEAGLADVHAQRSAASTSWAFNWALALDAGLQYPFTPTHAAMRALDLSAAQPAWQLAAALRRAFSGIVAGNVKAQGIAEVERHGPFEIRGEPHIVGALDALLRDFVAQGRMKLPGTAYAPCYRIVGD